MSKNSIILSRKDFTILEAMRDNPHVRPDVPVSQIRCKLDSAIVVNRRALPEGVASVNSRVTFRINGGESDSRVLSTGLVEAPFGMFQPITTPRGFALLGLSESQEVVLENADGHEERIVLDRVEYQPEAARRERSVAKIELVPVQHAPLLRVVAGEAQAARRPVQVMTHGCDDPGPSAA